MKKNDSFKINKNIDRTLNRLYHRAEPPKWMFVVIVVFYFITNFFTAKIAGKTDVLFLLGNPVPYAIFTGVFSALGNICIIFLVVFYGKVGFVTAHIILVLQFPLLLTGLFINHHYSNIAGFFTNIVIT